MSQIFQRPDAALIVGANNNFFPGPLTHPYTISSSYRAVILKTEHSLTPAKGAEAEDLNRFIREKGRP